MKKELEYYRAEDKPPPTGEWLVIVIPTRTAAYCMIGSIDEEGTVSDWDGNCCGYDAESIGCWAYWDQPVPSDFLPNSIYS